ncbi:MAG: hypothetical protein NC395_06570 [Prevotella sp.]|nr:hypothetical protein [Prevotella sp.]
MTDFEKNAGIPIDDDELDEVAGGVTVLPGAEDIQRLINSGETITVTSPTTVNRSVLTRRDGIPGTLEPLDPDTVNMAEEFRQRIQQARQFKN